MARPEMFVPVRPIEAEGTVVAGFVVLKRSDGSHAVVSERDGLNAEGRTGRMPDDEVRADIHQIISTAFDIANI